MKKLKIVESIKTNKIIAIICMIFFAYSIWIFAINRNYHAFIKPTEIQHVSDNNSFTFMNPTSGKIVDLALITTENYSATMLNNKLKRAQNIQLTTPKASPRNSNGQVQAYVFVDGQKL